jgi:hypothetical protein
MHPSDREQLLLISRLRTAAGSEPYRRGLACRIRTAIAKSQRRDDRRLLAASLLALALALILAALKY